MIVTFTTKSYADIMMFGDIALVLLKMMGHSPKVPGAILAADVPAALDRLQTAIKSEKDLPPVDDGEEEDRAVSLAHRSLPLIALLEAATKSGANVMWK